jgi:hypothetical protein
MTITLVADKTMSKHGKDGIIKDAVNSFYQRGRHKTQRLLSGQTSTLAIFLSLTYHRDRQPHEDLHSLALGLKQHHEVKIFFTKVRTDRQ